MTDEKNTKSPSARESFSEPLRTPESERDIGSALRAAYDRALEEEIPPAMLDLLSKLR